MADLPEAERVDIAGWGDHASFRVRRKNFVFCDAKADHLSLKLTHEEAAAVVATDPEVTPAGYGLGRHGWISFTVPVWLAQRGLDVTGIDLFPEAIEMARTGADAAGVRVDFLAMDLFLYQPGERFDLVFDFGCLHSLVGGSVTACRTQFDRWLAPRGTFVLERWGKRHLLDWRPGGPRRRSSAAIQRLFSPELRLDDAEATDFAAPLPSGVNGARHGVPLPSAVRPDRTAIAVIAYCRLRPSALAPAQAQ